VWKEWRLGHFSAWVGGGDGQAKRARVDQGQRHGRKQKDVVECKLLPWGQKGNEAYAKRWLGQQKRQVGRGGCWVFLADIDKEGEGPHSLAVRACDPGRDKKVQNKP